MDALRMSLSMHPNDSWTTYRSLHPSLWPDIPNDLFVALIDHQLQAAPSSFSERVQTLLVFAQKCGLELDQLGLPLVERISKVALGIAIAELKRGVKSYRIGVLNELWETVLRSRDDNIHSVPLDLRQAWMEFQLRAAERVSQQGKERTHRTKVAVAEAERFIQQGCGEGVGLFLGEILGVELAGMPPEEWDERIAIMGRGLAQGFVFPTRTVREVLGRARQAYATHGHLDPSDRLAWIVGEVGPTLEGPDAGGARSVLGIIADWIQREHKMDTAEGRLRHYAAAARGMKAAAEISVPRVIRLSLGILGSIHLDDPGAERVISQLGQAQPQNLSKAEKKQRWKSRWQLQQQMAARTRTDKGNNQPGVSRRTYKGVEGVDPHRALDVVLTMFERVSIRSAADVHVLVAAITGKLLVLLRQPSEASAIAPHVAFAPAIERFTRAIIVADLIGHIDDHLVHLLFDMLCECLESRASYILARRIYARARALDMPYVWTDKRSHHTRWRLLFKTALSQRPAAHLNFASRLYADRYVDIGSIFRQDYLHMVRAVGASGSKNPSKYILLERHIKDFVHDDPVRRNGFVLALVSGLTARRKGRDAWYGFHLSLRVLGDKPVPDPVYDMVIDVLSNTGRVVDWKRAIAVLDYVPVSHANLVEYYEKVFRGVLDGPSASQSQPARLRQETLTALYHHARERGVRPSAYMIESMAHILAEEGYIKHATAVLHTMVDHERRVPVKLGQMVLSGLVRNDMLDEAKQLEKRLVKFWRRHGEDLGGFVFVRYMHTQWLADKQEKQARQEAKRDGADGRTKTGGLARSLEGAFGGKKESESPQQIVPGKSLRSDEEEAESTSLLLDSKEAKGDVHGDGETESKTKSMRKD